MHYKGDENTARGIESGFQERFQKRYVFLCSEPFG
jgi:hypothetical protein